MSTFGAVAKAGLNLLANSSSTFRGDGNFTLVNHQESMADDGTYAMTVSGEGFIYAQAEDDECLIAFVEAAGTLSLLIGTTNTAVTNSDTDLCIYNNSGTVTIKNRLGATKTVTIFGLLM